MTAKPSKPDPTAGIPAANDVTAPLPAPVLQVLHAELNAHEQTLADLERVRRRTVERVEALREALNMKAPQRRRAARVVRVDPSLRDELTEEELEAARARFARKGLDCG